MNRLLTICSLAILIALSIYLALLLAKGAYLYREGNHLNFILLMPSLFFAAIGTGQFFILYWVYVKKEPLRARLPMVVSVFANTILALIACGLIFLFIVIMIWPIK